MSVSSKSEYSQVVDRCQVCDSQTLESILFLGYLPPVNTLQRLDEKPKQACSYPAELLYCPHCHLVQLGLVVDAGILFPPEYPYTSSTTKVLRDNFAELCRESAAMIALGAGDLIVDIGSNDGNLLMNFKDRHRVLGVTPEEIGKLAIQRGVPTLIDYFTPEVAARIHSEEGPAKIITATNVFAHIDGIHAVLDSIVRLLSEDGVFISESHYLLDLVEGLQYDTVYHEHLRYYSLHSLNHLLRMHGLELFHAKRIPTHGGSFRAYASRRGHYRVRESVDQLLREEKPVVLDVANLKRFRERVISSRMDLLALLIDIRKKGKRIFGISAPSRASTLINYTGIDDSLLDCVVEIAGSHKIGNFVPGTRIPILEESVLFEAQPDYALLLSWHIADELMPKIRARGFRGDFVVPLPSPKVIQSHG
jgi:hypothetical protein